MEELSPRARRLVESGVIDLDVIEGSGEQGRVTSGDILHAARVMEMEQSVPRIERAGEPEPTPVADEADPEVEHRTLIEVPEPMDTTESGTSTTAQVGGEPISTAPNPWEEYNGTSDGLSEIALPGAEQSWGEAEANIAAIAEEAAAKGEGDTEIDLEELADAFETTPDDSDLTDDDGAVDAASDDDAAGVEPSDDVDLVDGVPPAGVDEDSAGVEADLVQDEEVDVDVDAAPDATQTTADIGDDEQVLDHKPADVVEELDSEPEEAEPSTESIADLVAAANEAIATTVPGQLPEATAAETADDEVLAEDGVIREVSDAEEQTVPVSQGEEMMDFGTLELVDPESVWAEGAEDFAPWFLAHSQQLGDVLGLEAGLSDARQFTTKSATGVVGRDDNEEDVVVVASKSATADDSDLGRALGMAASSGAASVALVSASLDEDQLKALAWLNSQTKSGVRWYGIEMKVVRIAESPAAMLFDLVASPSPEASSPQD